MESVITTCLHVFAQTHIPRDIQQKILRNTYDSAVFINEHNEACVSKEFASYLRRLFKTTDVGYEYYAVRLSSDEFFPIVQLPDFSSLKNVLDNITFITKKFNIDFYLKNNNIF